MTVSNETRVREHLANERTFLAWVRTSIGIMAFGFVIEKFSLFTREINFFMAKLHFNAHPVFMKGASSVFGIAFVAFGVLICLFSFLKYKTIEKQIETSTYQLSMHLNILLTLFITLMGSLLVIYLIAGI